MDIVATGLMAFWSNIDPVDQLAFQRWHNCEHIPERVAIDGFLRGRRYRSTLDRDRFLMFYETRDAQVLGSAPYLAALNAPTARTREALAWFRKPARSVYRLEQCAGRSPRGASATLATVRFDIGDSAASRPRGEAAGAIETSRVDMLLESGLFDRVRIYRSEGQATRTNESAIHGALPPPLDGLLLGDSAELGLADRPEVRERLHQLLLRAFAGTALAGADAELYWLEFALDSGS